MKDILQDIIAHTVGIELIKVTGTDKETTINAVADDKALFISGTFKNPSPEFIGVVGMPNLNKLKTIVGFEEYDEHAKITVVKGTRDDPNALSSIHFETKNGDFVNDYRFMAKSIVEEKVSKVGFKGATWNVDIEPSIASILRLKKQASANSEETTFRTVIENNDLKVYFGDPSTHSGNFVFHAGSGGTMTNKWHWPVKQVTDILTLDGDKRMKISDQGAMEITVDSGLATYSYLLPGQRK